MITDRVSEERNGMGFVSVGLSVPSITFEPNDLWLRNWHVYGS